MIWQIFLIILLALLILFLSIIESAATRLSRLALRVLAEKKTDPSLRLLEEAAQDRRHFLLPLQFGIQILLIVTSILAVIFFEGTGLAWAPFWAISTMLVIAILCRQLIPRVIAQGRAEGILLKVLPVFTGGYRFLYWLSYPLLAAIRRFHALPSMVGKKGQEDEATDEEIQAYLGVGEEEGIFERTESELIQSALEFGSTLAREIMTPRNEMVTIEENASLAELKELVVSSKHSRIPVYRDRIDQITGIVYVRNLLSHLESGRSESESIKALINDALMIPETKKVSTLLKEMQASAEHMAIVVSEYGAVSGLVTIEDLLEEIVGEIRDEDELQRIDLIYEGNGTYVVRGAIEIEELEEALDMDLGEHDVTTASGLVVASLGKVPASGESLVIAGMEIEILSSNRKKIHTMRVRVAGSSESREVEDLTGSEAPRETT